MYKMLCTLKFMASLKLQFLYPRPSTLKLTCDINLVILRYIFRLEWKATLLKSHIKPKEGTYWSKLYYLINFNIDQLSLKMVHSWLMKRDMPRDLPGTIKLWFYDLKVLLECKYILSRIKQFLDTKITTVLSNQKHPIFQVCKRSPKMLPHTK